MVLKDKKDHKLEILTFDNNPETGKPYVSGYIKSNRSNSFIASPKGIARGYFAGVFTYNLNGHGKADVKEVFSYWDDHSNPSISSKGYYREPRAYAMLEGAFKDYKGDTYFIGNTFVKRTKWGTIFSSVVFLH